MIQSPGSPDITPDYDETGNIRYDGRNYYLYDAEGRVCALFSQLGQMMGYLYDAEGNRVATGTISQWSCNASTNGFTSTKTYILGPGNAQLTEMDWSSGTPRWSHSNVWAGGQLVATYSANGSAMDLNYHLTDWLGTRRVLTDAAGNLTQACASLPYGNGESCAPTPTEHIFTGKERDAESGNDYFGARYYASSMGRFLSPDWAAKATPVPYAKLSNPQSLNLYAYVFNNPLSLSDPDGHFVPLSDDEKTRNKQLEGLRSAVGEKAGKYLYDNVNVVDGKHYVGIYTNGQDGKGPSFENINGASKQIGAIINDQGREAAIQFVSPGRDVNGRTVGSMDAGQSPAVSTVGARTATINVTSGGFGEMNGRYTSDGRSTWNSLGDILSHELGHIYSAWYQGDSEGIGNSVRMENATRQMEGGPIRMFHDKPNDAGATTF